MIAGLTPALYGLANPIVLATAALFYVFEFFIDKVPYADTAWDAIHTIIRPVAAVVLVYAALGEASLPLQITGAALAGFVALAAHGVKAGLRLILNVRPRKVRTRLSACSRTSARSDSPRLPSCTRWPP